MDESGSEGAEWTQEHFLLLFARIKSSIQDPDRTLAYSQSLKNMDWKEVAFSPFSAEACQQKWTDVMHKLSKTRTLTELVNVAEDIVSNPAKNYKAHPEHPKRPPPPNAFFIKEHSTAYQMKHPNLSRQMVLKKLVRKYNKLPAEEKNKYLDKHKQASMEYKEAMQMFSKRYKPSQKTTETPEGVSPKPVLSGYHLFCQEQCSSTSTVRGDSFAQSAKRWQTMSDKQKEVYNQRHEELLSQYLDEMNQYSQKFSKVKQREFLKEYRIAKTMTDQKRKNKFPGEPEMPNRFGRTIFYKQQMLLLCKKVPNSRERLSTVNKLWKSLQPEEKQRYKMQASEEVVRYSMELQNWFETLPEEQQVIFWTKNPMKVKYLKCEEQLTYRPSDSEDELTQDSTDGELEEVEEEDNKDFISFEAF
uniref:nucleolar transcription factor 1-like isoform X1 n=1 Tax=Gasterosteus aculeatus aculeatus TaxID=481459 RepID=UPI001A97F336|nr:nucleolar transcription factor 1-like isoform X1 [Gasterosteus aculeatus aculeatus]